jgi:DNA polymerase-3 subunit epsilon
MSTPHKAFLIFASGPHLIVNQRHGLVDKPLFTDMADEFLAFVGDAPFVAHNASFIAFINAELARVAKSPIATERVVDTTVLARRKHPGGHNTLDDCTRVINDRSRRTQHGALPDAELLAAVYVELTMTSPSDQQLEPIASDTSNIQTIVRVRPRPLPPWLTADNRTRAPSVRGDAR